MGRRKTMLQTLALVALAATATAQAPSQFAGSWRAVLASPGGELPFTLRIAGSGSSIKTKSFPDLFDRRT